MNTSDTIELYFKKAKEIIPQLNFSNSLYFGNENFKGGAKIEFSTRNNLIESIFQTNKNNTYIHYTSIQSFIEILNSGNFRMYNCHNLNDPKEIEYGLIEFGLELTPDEIHDFKRNHFILSSCVYDEQSQDDFSMWRFYGDDGKGVGIVFEIEYGEEDFMKSGIHLGNVQYGLNNEKMELIKKFFKFHFEFNNEHHLFQNKPNLFPLLSSFFKKEIWQIEKESRIVATCKMENDFSPIENVLNNNCNPLLKSTLKSSLNKKGNLVSFLELPIKSKDNTELSKLCPKIKIKKIVLGYDVSEKLKYSVVSLTKQIGMNKFGYDIEYSESMHK
jgi:hypothetical protein